MTDDEPATFAVADATSLEAGKTYTWDAEAGVFRELPPPEPPDPRSPVEKFSDFLKAAARREYGLRQKTLAEKFFRNLYYLCNAEQVQREDPESYMGHRGWPAADFEELLRILHFNPSQDPPDAQDLKDALAWVCQVTARGTFLGGNQSDVEPEWERHLRAADRMEGGR